MNGILVINKPHGPTSHDVVDAVRRATGMKKVGHTGTLDPAATGVLPLVLGRGTKIAQYLSGANKSYRGTISLGTTTDTLDAQGQVLQSNEVPKLGVADIEKVLDGFRGAQEQIPPMYSAKKVKGKPLYALARKGIEVEREPKAVTITKLELESFDGQEIVVSLSCTAGTYVRVLAADVGAALGCGAHLKALERTQSGKFTLADAVELEAIVHDPSQVESAIVPLPLALSDMPRIEVSDRLGRRLCNGYQLSAGDLRNVDLPEYTQGMAIALGTESGSLVGVARMLCDREKLSSLRRDEQAAKTERVLMRPQDF